MPETAPLRPGLAPVFSCFLTPVYSIPRAVGMKFNGIYDGGFL
ncbi:hypothetical protein B4098_1905 [Heyndrickxia coagulans]|uniref:Uncharacterized protein n=1 Tax=Heyndrickxia coagulans TaxID=1398 RepID=A0A150K4D1_HEYCO|nr:hypothetical protein B4098_1905 [Heyndrickxia coagulans]